MAKVSHIAPIVLSNGIESVSVVSSVGSASITGDTLYLDFPAQDIEPFTINNQTVTGASVSGADVTFDTSTGIANVTISSDSNFIVNDTVVSAISVTGAANVNVESETAIVSISGGDGGNNFVINGNTVSGVNFGKVADVSIDANTGIADITINSAVAAGKIERVSVVGSDINASINNRILYLYTPAKPPTPQE